MSFAASTKGHALLALADSMSEIRGLCAFRDREDCGLV